MGELSDEPVEHGPHAIADGPIEHMDPQAHHPSIRSAGVRDIAAVLDLWAVAGSVPAVGDDSPEGLTQLLATDPQALLVAEVAGVLAGSLIAAWDGWRGSFYRLAVAPEHRRRGLATRLLREGEQRLRARGAIRLTAIVAEDEAEAMRFWRAVGYERQRRRARFVRHLDG
jgi:ribosomal protein S18 acetylase RimI-like enzyme